MRVDELNDEIEYPAEGADFFADDFGERITTDADQDAMEAADREELMADQAVADDSTIDTSNAFRERIEPIDTTPDINEEVRLLDDEMASEGDATPPGQDFDRSM